MPKSAKQCKSCPVYLSAMKITKKNTRYGKICSIMGSSPNNHLLNLSLRTKQEKNGSLFSKTQFQKVKNENWTAYYHLGVMYYVKSQKEKSIQAFKKSCQLKANHWSYRILANIEFESDNASSEALNYMDKGWQLCGQMPEFAEEYAAMLVKSESFERLRKLLDSLPENIKNRPRIQIAAAQSAFNSKQFDKVEDVLSKIELVNIRECETTLTDIWFEVQAIKRAEKLNCKVNDEIRAYVQKNLKPPKNIDFRMN